MNAFTKKTLVSALAAAGSLGMVGAANAVNVNPDGLGNVLIYPYYTVNKDPNGNAWTTLMSVVNSTNDVKSVKVRFREGLNSWEVLDFNVFLSPHDVWTGVVTAAATGGAQISTSDESCTIPAKGNIVNAPFRSTLYQGDKGGNGIARTAEGYFEVFEMATYDPTTAFSKAIIHSAGKPTCTGVNDAAAGAGNFPGTGGLFGTVVLVNVASGGAFTQNATALDNFGTVVYANTGTTAPDYTSGNLISNQISGNNFYHTTWNFAEDAVTAVLIANDVMNEYALDPFTTSATNWVVTHPTKSLYVNTGNQPPFPPFTVAWDGTACEPVTISEWNREEGNNVTQDFSPAAGGTTLCYEANVIGFSGVNLFGSTTFVGIATPFPNGWARLSFNDPGQRMDMTGTAVLATSLTTGLPLAGVGANYLGLPVIGFAAETFNNKAATIGGATFFASFGSEMAHRKGVAVAPVLP